MWAADTTGRVQRLLLPLLLLRVLLLLPGGCCAAAWATCCLIHQRTDLRRQHKISTSDGVVMASRAEEVWAQHGSTCPVGDAANSLLHRHSTM